MNALSWLGVVCIVLWAVLWLGLKMVSGIVHLLVLAGIALFVWGLLRRGVRAVGSRM